MVCDKIHAAVVAERERGFVQNSQQQLPQRVGGFLDFVKQQEADLQLLGVILRERLLRDQRMRFAVPQISRRRADQLGDFVRVLEFGAVDFDHRARIAEQALPPWLRPRAFCPRRWARETADCPRAVPASSDRRETPGTDRPPPAPLRPAPRSSGAALPQNPATQRCAGSDLIAALFPLSCDDLLLDLSARGATAIGEKCAVQ